MTAIALAYVYVSAMIDYFCFGIQPSNIMLMLLICLLFSVYEKK